MTTPASAAVAKAASSSRPGLNDRFLSDDLDVDAMTEVFEGESREISTQREAIVAVLPLQEGAAIADIGAGTGLFEPLFSEAVGSTGRVYAVDISPRFVAHLRERAENEQLRNVEVVLGSDRTAGLARGSVDVVFVCDTYHHFAYWRDMLGHLHAALRPGGQLVVIDFERIPGESPDWILEHVRAGKPEFRREIESAGFRLIEEVDVPGLHQNYVLRFERR